MPKLLVSVRTRHRYIPRRQRLLTRSLPGGSAALWQRTSGGVGALGCKEVHCESQDMFASDATRVQLASHESTLMCGLLP